MRMIDVPEKMGYCYFLMVVRSESMKPSLHAGDILVTYTIYSEGYCSKRREVDEIDELLKKGDVVVMEVHNKHIVHRLIDVECIPHKPFKPKRSNSKYEKLDRIGFMTKGDANTNNDLQLLYSESKHSERAIEHDACKKELITNTSLIRGKIWFTIPKLGLPVVYIRNTYLGKVCLCALWMIILYIYLK